MIALVRPLLYPSIQLASSEQVTEAHRLLGIACFKTRDEAGAEHEFGILLSNNPEKARQLRSWGITVVDLLPTGVYVSVANQRYLDKGPPGAAHARSARRRDQWSNAFRKRFRKRSSRQTGTVELGSIPFVQPQVDSLRITFGSYAMIAAGTS